MVSKAGVALKGVTTFLRAVEFLGCALLLGITSYWLGVLTHRHSGLPTWMKAVEGMAGGATLYTAFAVILTCFLGGMTFFAFMAVLLDFLFVAAMVAIAVLTRHGTHSCSGSNPPSPLGANNRTSCRLETAAFAVAIAMALLFLISAVLQVMLSRNHKKEKRYGPGPSNGYTSGTGKKQPFWKRRNGPKTTHEANEMGSFGTSGIAATNGTSTPKKQPFWKRNKNTTRDAELGAGGAGAGALIAEEKHRQDRKSHETGVTGTTAHSPVHAPVGAAYGGPNNKYDETNTHHTNHHGHHTNVGPDIGGVNSTYQPYRQGVGISEAGHQPHTQVIHDPNPYAEVHHGGFPHQAASTEYPTSTFGHGNYQAR
ncbi:MAG: hypothetical protein Q9182_007293 [Xanthomendoza sp. 2 TL-2023]